jgi:hypothetical protein
MAGEVKHSVGVNMVDNAGDLVKIQKLQLRRLLVDGESAGHFTQRILQDFNNNWLLRAALEIEDIREMKKKCCVVACGGGYDFLVLINTKKLPKDALKIPRVAVEIGLANSEGNRLENTFGHDEPLSHHLGSFIHDGTVPSLYLEPQCERFIPLRLGSMDNKKLVTFVVEKKENNTFLLQDAEMSKIADASIFGVLVSDSDDNSSHGNNDDSDKVNKAAKAKEPRQGSENKEVDAKKPLPVKEKAHDVKVDSNPVGKDIESTMAKDETSKETKKRKTDQACVWFPFCTKKASECGGYHKESCKLYREGNLVIPEGLTDAEHKQLKRSGKRTMKADLALTSLGKEPSSKPSMTDGSSIAKKSKTGNDASTKQGVKESDKKIASEQLAILELTDEEAKMFASKNDVPCANFPYCKKFASECGGMKREDCRELKEGRVVMPSADVLKAAKNKAKHKVQYQRRKLKKSTAVDSEDKDTETESMTNNEPKSDSKIKQDVSRKKEKTETPNGKKSDSHDKSPLTSEGKGKISKKDGKTETPNGKKTDSHDKSPSTSGSIDKKRKALHRKEFSRSVKKTGDSHKRTRKGKGA